MDKIFIKETLTQDRIKIKIKEMIPMNQKVEELATCIHTPNYLLVLLISIERDMLEWL